MVGAGGGGGGGYVMGNRRTAIVVGVQTSAETFKTTKGCKGPQTNMPKNAGSIRT